MTALLTVEDLHIRFGASHAVRGIEFELNEGEVLGLVGESGSGKSATSLAIMGLLGPAAALCGVVRTTSRKAPASIFFAPRLAAFGACGAERSP